MTNILRVKGCSDFCGSANEGTLSWRRLESGYCSEIKMNEDEWVREITSDL